MAEAKRGKVTLRQLQEMKLRKQRIIALGVYDSPMAAIADAIGFHIFMTGPSGPMSLFGHGSVAAISFEEQLVTLGAVSRVTKYALINAHMPYMSYHASPDEAIRNAARLVSEGGAETVKCDGTRAIAGNIRAIVDAGIPVIAHIGLQAARRVAQSGYGVKGRAASEAKAIYDDAQAMVDAGVFALLVEHVPSELMRLITDSVPVPTISLGAGGAGDGVCIISGDAVNYSVFPKPASAGRFADLRAAIEPALRDYRDQVRDRRYPRPEQSVHMPPEELERFRLTLAGRDSS